MNRLGLRYGKLLVIEHAPKPATQDRWLCRCDCGMPEIFPGKELDKGKSDCGCMHAQHLDATRFKHGHNIRGKTTSTYHSWTQAKSRCRNRNHPSWKNYGGRGIKFCAKWNTFPAFLADMGECPEGLSIHRIDNDGHYEPGNCKWATAKEQRNHQRPRLPVTLNGITMPAAHAAALLGVNMWSFYRHVRKHGAVKAVVMAQGLRTQA